MQAQHTSKEFKELIFKLLARNPEERPSVKQILNSKFLNCATYDEQSVTLTIKKKMELVLANQAKEKKE